MATTERISPDSKKPADVDDPRSFNHNFVTVNGIRMHYVEEGQGPLVILVHGFPYLWYTWRSQIRAMAEAGYRVMAPDLRGYGQTEQPSSVDSYDHAHSVGDLVGLMKHAGETSAVIVGHDLGVGIAFNAALLRPDLFRGLAVLCTIPSGRGPVKPSDGWKAMAKNNNVFYQQYFQDPKAAREMASGMPESLLGSMYSLSGSAAGVDHWHLFIEKDETILDTYTMPSQFPPWLSRQARDYYVSEYTRSGFSGALNHYRCRDKNWEDLSFLDGAVVRQPTICIAGTGDPCWPYMESAYANIRLSLTDLRTNVLLPGIGHSAPEEQPEQVSKLLLEFLALL